MSVFVHANRSRVRSLNGEAPIRCSLRYFASPQREREKERGNESRLVRSKAFARPRRGGAPFLLSPLHSLARSLSPSSLFAITAAAAAAQRSRDAMLPAAAGGRRSDVQGRTTDLLLRSFTQKWNTFPIQFRTQCAFAFTERIATSHAGDECDFEGLSFSIVPKRKSHQYYIACVHRRNEVNSPNIYSVFCWMAPLVESGTSDGSTRRRTTTGRGKALFSTTYSAYLRFLNRRQSLENSDRLRAALFQSAHPRARPRSAWQSQRRTRSDPAKVTSFPT